MQCIKQSSTLRISSKSVKPSPRIVFRYNEQGEQELAVYTIMSEEYWGEVHEDEDEEVENETEETNG